MSEDSPPHTNLPPPAGERCRDCGQPLPAGTVQGFCPVCVFKEMNDTLGDDPAALFETVPLRRMGDYELLEIIGRGGMGTVYLARREEGEVRALKMISAGELASPQARRRFMQEAGAASALQHPHIVKIHEVGAQDGMPFYVMDYVRGRTLADAVRDRPMPPHAAAACMAKVAAAIQHAHSNGVLHRDLKPSNILLDQLSEPHVTDFGLARQVDAESSLTGSQQILGSPAYMSPEQAAGRTQQAGPAADVYGLGAVLYHLLTGFPPFRGESPQAVLRQVTDDEPVPPRRVLPSVPRELETIVLKCLEKNPARRYVSARALEQELRRFLEGEPILARPVSWMGRSWRRVRRNKAISALSAVLVAGAVAGISFMVQRNRELQESDAEKSTALTEKEATLAESLLWQAEFQRLTGKPGQREGSLQAIREAMKLPLSPEQKLRARNAAIAALALPDAKFVPDPLLPQAPEPGLFLSDPGSRHFATASADGKVRITRMNDGGLVKELDLAPQRINALLRWTDDGQYLAYRFNDTRLGMIWVSLDGWMSMLQGWRWDDEVWPAAASNTPNQVAFHPNPGPGKTRAHRVAHADRDGSIVLREAFSGFIYRRIKPPDGPGPLEWRALAWDPRGKYLAGALGNRPEFYIWDMEQSPPSIMPPFKCRAPVESLDWEAQEIWLLAGDNEGRLTVWNPATRTTQPPFEGHSQSISSSATGWANYRHASASRDGTIRLWDRTAYRPLLTLPGQAARIYLTNKETRVGPLIHDGRLGWYDLAWPSCLRVLNPAESSEGERCAAYREGGMFAASLTGRSAVVWKASPVNGHHLALPHERPGALTWLPGSNWLAVAGADGLQLHALEPTSQSSLAAPVHITTQTVFATPCSDVSFDHAASLMAVAHASPETLEVYRIEATTARVPQKGGQAIVLKEKLWSYPSAPGTRCRLSPDGKWLAAGSPAGTDARIYSMADGKLAAEPAPVRSARNWLPVFSRDGALLLFGGRTAHVMLCGDWSRCDALPVPPNHGNGRGVEFVSAGKGMDFLAAVGGDDEVHLFRRANPGERMAVLRAPAGAAIGSLQCTANGMLCVAAPRGEVHLWPMWELRAQLDKLHLAWEMPATTPPSR